MIHTYICLPKQKKAWKEFQSGYKKLGLTWPPEYPRIDPRVKKLLQDVTDANELKLHRAAVKRRCVVTNTNVGSDVSHYVIGRLVQSRAIALGVSETKLNGDCSRGFHYQKWYVLDGLSDTVLLHVLEIVGSWPYKKELAFVKKVKSYRGTKARLAYVLAYRSQDEEEVETSRAEPQTFFFPTAGHLTAAGHLTLATRRKVARVVREIASTLEAKVTSILEGCEDG